MAAHRVKIKRFWSGTDEYNKGRNCFLKSNPALVVMKTAVQLMEKRCSFKRRHRAKRMSRKPN
ncbi:hypothetical protein CLOSTMETH_00625 [[Clostridium] methylpentosum DSM 5476]|uniref:Uncharacterized protein n=1 Tax=[Clostridium] methylpentosum DSM 5476 TaxID=537013 RepID=C0E9X3_9FIRM|nr:hypothetical protein CLOSTMETH_00625 [[Clostridium] methylpentosum DSM 5476]